MARRRTAFLRLLLVLGMVVPGGAPLHAQDAIVGITDGDIHYRDGAYAKARDSYTRVLADFPDNVRALNNRGLALVKLGRQAEALADLDRALSLEKANGDLWNNRANLHCAMKRASESFSDRLQAFYNGRFTLEQAQTTLRRLGYFKGLADAVWDEAEDLALRDWTEDGCPNAPADRLI